MPKVIIYVSGFCPFCRRAEALLRQRGISYKEIDLTGDQEARSQLVATTGMMTVPQIFVDDVLLGGYQELAAADRSGALEHLRNSDGNEAP